MRKKRHLGWLASIALLVLVAWPLAALFAIGYGLQWLLERVVG